MIHTLPPSTTRSNVARSSILLLIAGACLLARTSRGDEPPKAPAPVPVLHLVDGGFVPGSLGESNRDGIIRWNSEAFSSPLEFAVDAIRSIRFPTPEKLPRPGGSFGFELTGGDLLFGTIVRLDDKVAVVDAARIGRLRVERSRIRRIFRWRDSADLVYNGPNGLAGWREIAPAKRRLAEAAQPRQAPIQFANIVVNVDAPFGAPAAPKPAKEAVLPGPTWIEDGGQLETIRDGATIQSDVGLPSRASLEIDLSWKNTPDFVLAVGVSDDEKTVDRAFRFEVWDGQLVVLRESDKEGDVVSIQPIPGGPGRAQLQLFLDQESGKLLVFSDNGGVLADEINLGGRPGPPLTSVRLTNIRGDIRLERLRVGHWDGETPRLLKANASRVQLTDKSISRDKVDRLDADTREFILKGESGETRIAEDRISNIYFSSTEDKQPRKVCVVSQDGTRFSGEWVKVEGNALILSLPGIEGSIRLPIAGLRSLDVVRPDGKARENPVMTGMLELDGLRVLGRLVDSGEPPAGGGLVWQPLASDSSSPIRPGSSGRIFYRTSRPAPKSTTPTARAPVQRDAAGALADALTLGSKRVSSSGGSVERRVLYLRTGDIIPAEITGIDEKGVSFRTEFTDNGFVPHSRIKAVEMATETGNSIKVNKAKFERLLTLPRMQKDSPPTHLIRSKNGDILRGRIIAMDDKTIRVEVRLEEKEIPRERVSRIIWLHADEVDPSKKAAEPPGDTKTIQVQAVRSDGIRLTFAAERFADGFLSGKSEALGDCKVRAQELDQLLIGKFVEKEASQLAYQNWKLQNAPEPKSAQVDESGSPNGGVAGTESALVGKQAPDFQLDLLGGKKFHLAENKGQVIVLDFWASWCGPCIQAMPQIDKVTHEFADKGVQLIAVNLQETPAKISAMLERLKLSPAVALDRDGVVAQKYGANAIPQTVVIDRDGKITRLFIGGGLHLGDQLREALQSLMPVENPR